ncbi:MAG: DUF885 domain-containing protein [Allosphingosinicella sp.]|uniref:DUF885 domain-containing protein n=1 Tax=Allosphingosinicella sp. TaxID=2823234 RepID=UPI003952E67B
MRTFIIAALLATSAPAVAAPADDFRRLMDEHWQWTLRNNPVWASTLGYPGFEGQVADISLAARERQVAEARALLARLDAIPAAELSPADRTNQAMLRRALSEGIEASRFGQRNILFTNRSGWHQEAAGMANFLPFRNRADYESYLRRLEQYPRTNREAMAITRQAVSQGYNLPCEAMENFDRTIIGVVVDDPARSRFYQPFTRTRPLDMSEAEWTAMQQRARTLIEGTLYPEYRAHHQFYLSEVAPRCAREVGVSAQPQGAEFYAFRVRQMTTTDMTPDQIHQLGLSEVARIRAEMEEVSRAAGFPSREAFIQELRTNPVYYPRTGEELMREVARVTKEIDGHMPRLFGTLPRLPYTIREIPAETAEGTTTAYYNRGSLETGIPGIYYVNTSKLDQRPLWEVPALSVHEAVPGHHHQIALQQELDLPDFRRFGTFVTAFSEGWGLYTERLGIEMGLYDTPARDMGRLSYEMWRATRLVVDTGLHAKGWNRQQAVDYMMDNTALSRANIEAEVNRYIANPGQAVAYKIGELKFRELRARAEQELGGRFDIRRFHDTVLEQGAVPLDVLERHVLEWIAREKAAA